MIAYSGAQPITLSAKQAAALKRLNDATDRTNHRRWASTTGLRIPAATLAALERKGLARRRPPANQHFIFPRCFRRRVHRWTVTPLGRKVAERLAQQETARP